jgi:hypothetical protein
MNENLIVGIVVGLLQGLILLVLAGIRSDIKDLWERVYNHRHEVRCLGEQCHQVHTGNVIVPGGGGE